MVILFELITGLEIQEALEVKATEITSPLVKFETETLELFVPKFTPLRFHW